jgi:hypothetical protein
VGTALGGYQSSKLCRLNAQGLGGLTEVTTEEGTLVARMKVFGLQNCLLGVRRVVDTELSCFSADERSSRAEKKIGERQTEKSCW